VDENKSANLKGYVCNAPVTVMPATEVIAQYHDLWHVEKSFRMSKSDLRGRPMFHYTREAIEAHLTIVFTALARQDMLDDTVEPRAKRVRDHLSPIPDSPNQ